MTISELQRLAALLREFREDVGAYDVKFQELKAGRYISNTAWMAEPQPHNLVHDLGGNAVQVMQPLRDQVGKNIDEVTKTLDSLGVPTIWKVYPPPAFGGLIRTFNAFQSFIDLELEYDARPTFLQIQDLVNNAIWKIDKQVEELSIQDLNPPSTLSRNVPIVAKKTGAVLSWLFPTEKQRGVLGWILIAGILAAILRFLFGIHLEGIGALLLKVVK